MKKIEITAVKATPKLMEEMEKKGLLRRLKPSKVCVRKQNDMKHG